MTKRQKKEVSVKVNINIIDEFARFLGRLFGPATKNISDILGNETALWKLKNGLRLRDKVEQIRVSRNIPDSQFAEMRIGVPLIEKAILEDNEDIQDLWASLLASSMQSSDILFVERSFIDTLSSINPKEAHLLRDVYSKCVDWFDADNEPTQQFLITIESGMISHWYQFRNLERLGLIKIGNVACIPGVEFSIVLIDKIMESSKADGCFNFSIFLTSYGYRFMRMVTGQPLLKTKGGGEVAIVDIDAFYREFQDERMKLFFESVAAETRIAEE
jgi:hypothetical protein